MFVQSFSCGFVADQSLTAGVEGSDVFIKDEFYTFFLSVVGRGVVVMNGGHVGGQFAIVDDGQVLFFAAIDQVHFIYKCIHNQSSW